MRRITVLAIAFTTLLPAPSHATTTTFVAPFLSATVETRDSTADAPLAESSAEAAADASDGSARVHVLATSKHPVPILGQRGIALARFTLGQISITSGRVRITSVLSGEALARRQTTLEATRGAYAFVLALPTFGNGALVEVQATGAPMTDDEVTASGTIELEHVAELTEGGFCPDTPLSTEMTFSVGALAAARNVSTYEAFADVVLESVTVEQLPCVPEPAPVDVLVSSETFSYSPSAVTVPVGTVVEWTWDGGFPHTVTADDGSFASPTQSDGTFTHRFDVPGTYGYYCELHGAPGEGMAGTVTVT